MNKRRTTGLKKLLLAIAAGLFIWTSAASAQDTLADLLQQTGCNWIIGKWVGETSDGQKYEIEYKWALKDHVVSVHFKGFNIEYHGIIFYKADAEEVVQIGVDNNGGNGKGTWVAENGKAVWRNEVPGEYGEVNRMGFVYTKIDAQTMKADVHGMDEYGELSEEPVGTLEYKRQKTQPKKTAATTTQQ
ncbi:MAG: hypothetical protein CEE38_20070 [Planctomycetes bacterium B3_Pla]|nr:MAG: hypothetical protein CEE38_20070 [Planctomycetes bacterium B3_Pla]